MEDSNIPNPSSAVTQKTVNTKDVVRSYTSSVRPSFYVYNPSGLQRYEIAEGDNIFLIGYGDQCDITIDDPSIDNEQLIVVKLGDYCYFMDCGAHDHVSFNGVKKRQASVATESRMLMKIGKTWVVYLGIDAMKYVNESETVILRRSLVMGVAMGKNPEAELLLKSDQGETVSSNAPILVGTHSTCDYRITGKGIKPFHFMIYFSPNGAFIEDLTAGTPGLKVNDISSIGAHKIICDVTISIGEYDFYLYVYGNIERRCRTLFTALNPKPQLMLTSLSSPDTAPIILVESNQKLSVGRSEECDIVINDESVSRIHAFIIVRDKCLFLEDNNSANKSQVNLRSVEKTTVRAGDIVEFGHTDFLVHYQ